MYELKNIKRVQSVTSNTLLPVQQVRSASKILRSADCYQQRFIKFTDIGIFHSYSELLHASLLEADPNVSSFTPQPLSLLIKGKRRYVPDCYYVKSGKRYVVELKPSGDFNEELKVPLELFFDYHNIKFEVISNESILENEMIALNWLHIIRTLISAVLENTETEEIGLWEEFLLEQKKTIGDIISIGNRINGRAREISLFRLVHRGKLKIDFNDREIGLDTEVSLCK
ncbi:MAG: hypothetical protein COA63_001380 [Methylophaga sp.]|nr:hypothetical protein [Methylophaga sp.]